MPKSLWSLAVLAFLFGGTSAATAQSAEVQRFEAAVRAAEARRAPAVSSLTPEQQAALQARLLVAQGRLVLAPPQGDDAPTGNRYSAFGQTGSGTFTQPVFQQGGYDQTAFQGNGVSQPTWQGTYVNQNFAQNFNQVPNITGNFLPPPGFFSSVGYVETTTASNSFGRAGSNRTQAANPLGQFRAAQGNFRLPVVATQGFAGHCGAHQAFSGRAHAGQCGSQPGSRAGTQFIGALRRH